VFKSYDSVSNPVYADNINLVDFNTLQPLPSVLFDERLAWQLKVLSETTVQQKTTNASSEVTTHPPHLVLQKTTTSPEVLAYLKKEEEYCLIHRPIEVIERVANRPNGSVDGGTASPINPVNWCPCLPPDLRGRVRVDMTDDPDGWPGVLRSVGRDILVGGEWRPADCVPTTHLAVIIPCRDRDSHLRIMLRQLYPILQRQLSHFKIFVVEQNSPAVFNKAAMMNIGFLEAEKRFPEMNCVMFHDVDHLLEDDRSLMKCGEEPHHYAAAMDEWNYRLIYTGAFGGVVTMRPQVFRKVNGYSLQYFGWGGEDDDMGDRVRHYWPVTRPPMEVCRYSTIKHDADGSNPRNEKRHGLMSNQHAKYANGTFDGLSDINYQLYDVKFRPMYTFVHADLNVSQLATYPTHAFHRYHKLPGVCPWQPGGHHSDLDVSWTTCRYLCDAQPRRPCLAFSYRSSPRRNESPISDKNGRPLFPPKCVIHSTACDQTELTKAAGSATFIKGPIVSGGS